MLYARRWELAKEAVNSLLGVGFGHSHDGACAAYAEFDGDFGVPTASDLQDFIDMVSALDPETAPSRAAAGAAVDGSIAVLALYGLAAFGAELAPTPV